MSDTSTSQVQRNMHTYIYIHVYNAWYIYFPVVYENNVGFFPHVQFFVKSTHDRVGYWNFQWSSRAIGVERHDASRCNEPRDSSRDAARCKFVVHALLRIQQRIPLLPVLFLPALCFIKSASYAETSNFASVNLSFSPCVWFFYYSITKRKTRDIENIYVNFVL